MNMGTIVGMIKVAPPGEVIAEQKSAEAAQQTDHRERMSGLARYVNNCFDSAYRYKQRDLQRFVDAYHARRGEYPPDKLAKIREVGGSEEYARICANKSRVLQAWLEDIFVSTSERPWTIEATPVPALSEDTIARIKEQVSVRVAELVATGQIVDDVAAQNMLNDELDMERMRQKDAAQQRAERMADVLADQLEEGVFRSAFSTFLGYFVTYPGAIFKGPIFRKRSRLVWDAATGTYAPRIESRVVMEFDAPDPMNCYPSPGATQPDEGYFIEHITLTSKDLYDLIGVDGYNEEAIRAVLDRAGNSGLQWVKSRGTTSTVGDSSPRTEDDVSGYIDVLEFHGPVKGKDLAEWGLLQALDPQQYYEATVWLVDDVVIKAVLNDDPLGRRPYYKACYEEAPNQFWGYSLYDVLADVQGVANAAIRSLVNNMAIASGPQVVVHVDHLPAGTDITNMHPWKIWQVVDGQFGTPAQGRPIDFFQPNANVQELLAVLDRFYALADDFSLIPRYMAGSDRVSGPARTASGLSMLLDAANKGMKSIVNHIDRRIITPLLQALFDHNMIYNDDPSIKGDAQIVARGVASLMQLETLRMRRNEFLQITANPIDSQIVGASGRAAILREIAKMLGMDVNKIIPPDKVLNAAAQPQQPMDMLMPTAQQMPHPSQEQLANGAPVADFTSPRRV